VAAAVVLPDGAVATAEELREFVKGESRLYKVPRASSWLVDELPKDGQTGKILKRDIPWSRRSLAP
jgi:long-chain acyl-CoA synthetase